MEWDWWTLKLALLLSVPPALLFPPIALSTYSLLNKLADRRDKRCRQGYREPVESADAVTQQQSDTATANSMQTGLRHSPTATVQAEVADHGDDCATR